MSLRSPKHKFRGEITFEKATKELGSVVSYTSNDIDVLKSLLYSHKLSGYVVIRENKSEYPAFDWHIVESYQYEP